MSSKKLDLCNFFYQQASLLGFSGSILIKKRDQILLSESLGFSNIETKTLNTAKTTFRIASLTKAFTSFLLFKLEEENILSLNTPLSKFFPSECIKNPSWKEITLERLINHTSGLKNLTDLTPRPSDEFLSIYHSPEELTSYINQEPLLFAPGTKYHYTNLGYIVLATLIERALRTDFNTALENIIFTPQKLFSTSSPTQEKTDTPLAQNYLISDTLAPYQHPSVRIGAGNLLSNTLDLSKWLTQNNNTPKAAPKPIHGKETETINYSFGWIHKTIQNQAVELHKGSMPGCRTLILRVPKKNIQMIILGNKDLAPPDIKDLSPLAENLLAHLID